MAPPPFATHIDVDRCRAVSNRDNESDGCDVKCLSSTNIICKHGKRQFNYNVILMQSECSITAHHGVCNG